MRTSRAFVERRPGPMLPTRLHTARLARRAAVAVVSAAALVVIVVVAGHGRSGPAMPRPTAALRTLDGIPQDGSTLGSATAPATLTIWSSLLCQACSQFTTYDLPAIIGRWVRPGRLRLQVRTVSTPALLGTDITAVGDVDRFARLLQGAGLQDRLWPTLLAWDATWGGIGYLDTPSADAILGEIPGLDAGAAQRAAATPRVRAAVARANVLAAQLGVGALPAFTLTRSVAGAPQTTLLPAAPATAVAAIARALSGPAVAASATTPASGTTPGAAVQG